MTEDQVSIYKIKIVSNISDEELLNEDSEVLYFVVEE